ncbi:Multidrug resistance protein MdtL [Streptomyces griseoloalbus]
MVNVALPSVRGGLGLDEQGLQWVVNAYSIAFAGFMLLGGRAGDLYGRKRMFLVGLGLFTLASLAGGLAQEGWQLLVARAVQGLGRPSSPPPRSPSSPRRCRRARPAPAPLPPGPPSARAAARQAASSAGCSSRRCPGAGCC